MTWDRRLYFPYKRKRAAIFIALKNRSPRPVFEPTNLGSNSKQDNHYTTEATHTRCMQCQSRPPDFDYPADICCSTIYETLPHANVSISCHFASQ
jgi:hypothetical protein